MWNWKNVNLLFVMIFLLLSPSLEAQEGELIVYSPDQSLQLVAKQNLGRTRINILEPQGKGELYSWEIKDFQVESVQFTKSYPKRLLIASDKTIYVYDLSDNKKKLILTQPVESGKSILDAGFAEDEQEIYWSTKQDLLTSGIKESKPKKVYEVKDSKPIQDVTALKNKRVVLSQEGTNELTLINTKKPESPTILKGHKEKVVGVASPDGQNLYSLDEGDELARWDLLNKEVSLKQRLSKKEAKPTAMNLDASGKNILVQYKGEEQGVKYSIDSIEDLNPKAERVAFTKGFGKKLFEAAATNQASSNSFRDTFSATQEELEEPKDNGNADKNGKIRYFKLAEIEAANQNFEAALGYIKQVSLTSTDYAASRKLQREVYSQLEVKAQLQGAMDQYKRGSYDSAKVLVRSTLAKFPKHPVGLRYKKMIEKKEQEQFISSLITGFLIVGGLGLLALILYRRRDKVKVAATGFKVSGAAKKKGTTERKKFVILYQQTKNQLNKLVEYDKHHLMTTTWKAIHAQLELVEQKSRQPQVNYRRLNEELALISKDLSKRYQDLKAKSSGKKQTYKKEEAGQKTKPKDQKKSQEKKEEPKKEANLDPNFIDFYELLGIKATATEAEIKKAYRSKIKEYHPDHHDASSFKWVKEEAGRMTQKLGEGYEILRDAKQRSTYDKMRKQQGK